MRKLIPKIPSKTPYYQRQLQFRKKQKKALFPWRDMMKMLGTALVLICWGWENLIIKPKEAVKSEQIFRRNELAHLYTNEQITRSRAYFTNYIYKIDTGSNDAKGLAIRAGWEFCQAGNWQLGSKRVTRTSNIVITDEEYRRNYALTDSIDNQLLNHYLMKDLNYFIFMRSWLDSANDALSLHRGAAVTGAEIEQLAALLQQRKPNKTTELLQKIYDNHKAGFIQLIKHVLDIEKIESFETTVNRAFENFIAAHSNF